MKEILLTTINAKWIHPSLALRLLKANLGSLEDRCEILELNLRQPLAEKLGFFAFINPKVLGVSVSIWNHTAAIELLSELEKIWINRPVIVLGGPEVSHLPESAEIFSFADYIIRGEGENAFRILCWSILSGKTLQSGRRQPQFITAENVDVNKIKSGYNLYTDEDLAKKLVYVEASRGCLFNCEFCLSAVKNTADDGSSVSVREFDLDTFLAEMDMLVKRGAKTFKFLDRSFNTNIKRALRIMEFFLEKIKEQHNGIVVHFEMVPSLFPPDLREMLTRFPPGTLRLEIGIQTLNSEVAARIGRICAPDKELEAIQFLHEKTNAIVHVDLIAGLPGDDLTSFGRCFDLLWQAIIKNNVYIDTAAEHPRTEIQLGILKLLPGALISRHNEIYGMNYNPLPPYEILETSTMNADDLRRLGNFARFWELLINRCLIKLSAQDAVFQKFMALSDALFAKFGRNWGIGKDELLEAIGSFKEIIDFLEESIV